MGMMIDVVENGAGDYCGRSVVGRRHLDLASLLYVATPGSRGEEAATYIWPSKVDTVGEPIVPSTVSKSHIPTFMQNHGEDV